MPVDLDILKDQLKIARTNTSEDIIINIALGGAIRACENKLQRSIMDAVHELYASSWKCRYDLQQYPVSAINSVKYYDVNGALQSVSTGMYRAQSFRAPSYLEFDGTFDSPSYYDREFPIIVNFNAGHLAATGTGGVSDIVRGSILMEAVDRYENRQSEIALERVSMFSNNAEAWLAQESLWI